MEVISEEETLVVECQGALHGTELIILGLHIRAQGVHPENFLGSSHTGASPPNSYLQGWSLLGRLALRARAETHFCPLSPEQVLRCSRKTVILSWARRWVL